MSRQTAIARLDEHPNLSEILGVLWRLPQIADADLPALAQAWVNSPSLAAARDRALSPDSPLVLDVLAAFDAVSDLFADDLAGQASWLTVDVRTTALALKAVRDAVAAVYARPALSRLQYAALLRPWRTVYPGAAGRETDLGPQSAHVKALLTALPILAGRCHDPQGQVLFDALVDHSYVSEGDRALAAEVAFQAAVLTGRRRLWVLVRRLAVESLTCSCGACGRPPAQDGEARRVRALCLDAACALLVADALAEQDTALLTTAVRCLIPLPRSTDRAA